MSSGLNSKILKYQRTLGMTVMEGKGFYAPNDMSLAPNGRIYVLNRSIDIARGMGIRICDSEDGFFGSFGKFGSDPGDFNWPSAIASGLDSQIYVADEYKHKIMTFSPKGDFIREWGVYGKKKGELDTPSGVVVDRDNNLVVSDTYNHRVQIFDTMGVFLKSFGKEGSGDGELNMPWRLSIDLDSNIYVADWGNDRISIFDSQGKYLKSHGMSGSGDGQLFRPAQAVSDSSGNIYVCDWGNERIQVLDKEGHFIEQNRGESQVSPWAQNFLNVNNEESDARDKANLEKMDIPFMDPRDRHEVSSHIEKYFWAPMSLAISEDEQLFVLESNRHRIQIFEMQSESLIKQ
ncbi:MAG: hypothetical protein CL896_02670 [Dehalococcoidia bacterium]|nr:hypothetical protein [Dehalococcoidia bacterium]